MTSVNFEILAEVKAKTPEEVLLNQYTNCIAFLSLKDLPEKDRNNLEELYKKFKQQILEKIS